MSVANIAYGAVTGATLSQSDIAALAYAVLGASAVCDDADQGFGPSSVTTKVLRGIIERDDVPFDAGLLGVNQRITAVNNSIAAMQAAVLAAIQAEGAA